MQLLKWRRTVPEDRLVELKERASCHLAALFVIRISPSPGPDTITQAGHDRGRKLAGVLSIGRGGGRPEAMAKQWAIYEETAASTGQRPTPREVAHRE